jgi:hypothetical protein
MFPNVRMMIVAMLASVAAVICAMAVFAAFGVTHEPFAQLPGDKPPLQLVFDHTVPAADGRALTFGVRFQMDAAASDAGAVENAAAPNIPVVTSAPAAAPARQTVADPNSVLPDAAKPPAAAVADAAKLVHRRLVRRAPGQFAGQNSSQSAFQWPQPAPAPRPATRPISRAAANKILSDTPAAELPPPTIQ